MFYCVNCSNNNSLYICAQCMAGSAALAFAAVSEIAAIKWADKDHPEF